MAHTFLKADQIVSAGLGVLERELVLQNMVASDVNQHFSGRSPKNDTISIRIDGRTTAFKRGIRERSATGHPHTGPDGIIKTSDLTEFKVDVRLTDHHYSSVQLTDEEHTLDIADFTPTVVIPQVRAVAEAIEDQIAATIRTAANYTAGAKNLVNGFTDDVHGAIVDARKILNDRNVPQNDRVLIIGTAVEAHILKSEQFRRFDHAGDNNALRNATIGSIAGMPVVVCNTLDEDEAFAFHKTAFQTVYRVPKAPLGGVDTGSGSYAGIALRWVKDYDPAYLTNRSTFDTFFGISVVKDPDDYTDPASAVSLKRAVKINLTAPTTP